MRNARTRFWRVVCITLPVTLLVMLLVSKPSSAQNRVTGQVIGVPAGDQIRIQVEGWQVTVRLHGITSPTTPPELVERLRAYTERRVAGTRVTVEVRGTGPKQTLYGEVYPPDSRMRSLNEELVAEGLATWAREYAPKRRWLGDLEAKARAEGRGFWGDATGATIALPPPAQDVPTPAPKPTTRNAKENRVTVTASPPPATAATPAKVTVTTRSTGPVTLPPARALRMTDVLLPLFIFLTAAVGSFLYWRTGGNRAAIPAQVATGILLAGAVTVLVPLLWSLATGLPQNPWNAFPAGLVLLAVLGGGAALAISRSEQILRATPHQPMNRLQEGFRRVAGEVSAPFGLVESKTGHIPAIYIREVSYRCTTKGVRPAHGQGPRRTTPHEWVQTEDETRTIDFLVSDDQGSVVVVPDRATFRPLRVARFYNEVPVEEFFDNPYGGDTRTEVYFIPATANLVVWGRAYQPATASSDADEPPWHIAYDPLAETLLVVEENPARVFTSRPLWGLLLTLLAVGLTVVAVIALLSGFQGRAWPVASAALNPLVALAGVLFVVGLALLGLLVGAGRTVLRYQRARCSAWEELDAAFQQRAERLEATLPGIAALIPDVETVVQRVRLALSEAMGITHPATRLEAEKAVSHYLRELLPELDRARGEVGETVTDLRIELRAREAYLREATERYRAADYASKGLRGGLLTGLLARALTPEVT